FVELFISVSNVLVVAVGIPPVMKNEGMAGFGRTEGYGEKAWKKFTEEKRNGDGLLVRLENGLNLGLIQVMNDAAGIDGFSGMLAACGKQFRSNRVMISDEF